MNGNRWNIQAGVKRNYFGIGDTSLFGEYGKQNGWGSANGVFGLLAGTGTPIDGGDTTRVWGLGVVQNIDAAAMELYFGWRNYKASDNVDVLGFKDLDIVAAGARIKF